MNILSTHNLTKTYGTGDNVVHALTDVSLDIEEGKFVSIIGSSGSGKSTLLNLLGGLDRPTSGDVILDGKAIFEMDDEALTIFRRRKIGFARLIGKEIFHAEPVVRRPAAEGCDSQSAGSKTFYHIG